ncbi:C-type lectin domain family 4 member A-like [Cavia porcellus]|uniref:C-type lectin domain-containing protein n=1 Tax=Cavia porcellus TaxID=10141 RepID=A0A286Y3R3_CAVPO|nr:C-type lectin domain family 4 member A-like [Cavia porcellus]
MAAEVTYAELRIKTESSGTNPDSPKGKTAPQRSNLHLPKMFLVPLLILLPLAIIFCVTFIIFFQKYSQLLEEKKAVKECTQSHTELWCKRSNSCTKEKVWSCCPKNWISFNSHCYFYPNEERSWHQSVEYCSHLEAHLVVITSKEEQDFITKNMNNNAAYYIGLSDPQGHRQWQWVDKTPYNKNVTFWHFGEPSNVNERCVFINYRDSYKQWGWNDARCDHSQQLVCKMMNICF